MISNGSDATSLVTQVVDEFKGHIDMKKEKMHRYPACLGSVDEAYTLPRIVAIGPYNHGLDHLKPAETVKHTAACHCVMLSGCLLEDLYGAVVPVADSVRCLYDKDVMAGIGYEDFRHMMFFDACFLVQFMLTWSGRDKVNMSLRGFFWPNHLDIFRDVMLLENQIPWIVVEAVMSFMPMSSMMISRNFVCAKRHCMLPDDDDRDERPQHKPFVWYDCYKPPHLLGLLRYYIVGTSDTEYNDKWTPKNDIPASVSVLKLTEMGIMVAASKTTELTDMSLNKHIVIFAKLSLPPLSLDRDRASYLVNMAALELCAVRCFDHGKACDATFCSYLLLLAMLVYREEDVHELRVRGLLVGGGLADKDVLKFLKTFQGLRVGKFYNYVMEQIERYRENNNTILIKCYSRYYRNKKTLGVLLTIMLSAGGIIVAILKK